MINSIFILYVSHQEQARAFYEAILEKGPELHVPGMTEFALSDNFKLGLMPESGIEKIICPALPRPSTAAGIPRCELYLYLENPEKAYQRALDAGAISIQPLRDMDWGDSVAYVGDPFGHVVAFARKAGTG